MRATRFCALVTSFALGGQAAAAATHDWVMKGTVLEQNGSSSCFPAVVGDTFRMDFRFDDAAPMLPTVPNYSSITSWKFRFDSKPSSLALTSPSGRADGSNGGVTVLDDVDLSVSNPNLPAGPHDWYVTETSAPMPAAWQGSAPVDCGSGLVEAEFIFADDTLTLFSSTTQPTTPFDPLGPPALVLRQGFLDLDGGSSAGGTSFSVLVSTFVVAGSSQDVPILPEDVQTVVATGQIIYTFSGCPIIPCWYDPPFTSGYIYETSGGALFTSIDDFPTGLGGDFEVIVGGSSLGTFGTGDSVDFGGYPGGGVDRFEIRGIDPPVDAADDLAFPLKLSLDTAGASFTMTSLAAAPVPGLTGWGAALLGAAVGCLGGLGLWRGRAG